MRSAGIKEIKQELSLLPPKQVLELCLRLVRYKKENKELLSYLLFEANDESGFVENVKKEIDEGFAELPLKTPYLTRKSLGRVLRSITRYSKQTGTKESAIEILMHFCIKLKSSGIPIKKYKTIFNLYNRQLKKLQAAIELVHEDLRFDYKKQLEKLA